MSDLREAIIRGAARAHFVDAWANWQGEHGWPAGNPSGRDLMDMIPEETPVIYDLNARKLVRATEDYNGRDIEDLYVTCVQGAALPPAVFGHYLYMQAVGHGVGLWDFLDAWMPGHGHYDTPYWATLPYEPDTDDIEAVDVWCGVPGCECKRP